MTLTFEPDLEMVRTNKHNKYLGQRSLCLKLNSHTETHAHNQPTALPRLQKWYLRKNQGTSRKYRYHCYHVSLLKVQYVAHKFLLFAEQTLQALATLVEC